jgi:hypothetical protein
MWNGAWRVPLANNALEKYDFRRRRKVLPLARRSGIRLPPIFAHRIASHLDAMRVVHEPVENAIGQGWIADLLVPA